MSTTETSPSPDDTGDAKTGRLDGASRVRIFSVLAIIVLYTEVVPFQYTMIGAALQKMTKTFSDVGGNINWAIIIVGVVGASATPLLGKASDIWGKKRLFLFSGVLFFVGCLIDALTSNWTVFLIGRGLSSLAIASQFIAYGLIRDIFPRKYIPIGLGMVGAGLGVSTVFAPVIGGFLVDHYDWRAMFWFLAIFTFVMTPIVAFAVPESPLRVSARIDWLGGILLAAGILLALLYLDNGQNWGWSRPSALAWLIVGVVLLALFCVVELRVSNPIMDMRLLVNPKFGMVLLMGTFGVGITALMPTALGYMTQTPDAAHLVQGVAQGVVAKAHVPAELVHVTLDPGYSYGNGFSLLGYALHIAIWPGIMLILFAPIAGMLARRAGSRLIAITGFGILTVSTIAFALVHYSWPAYLVCYLVAGIGVGCIYAAQPNLIVDAVPAEQQGISAGMFGVTQSIGSAVIIAVSTVLLNNNPVKAHIDIAGHQAVQAIPQVFADRAYTQGFWVAVGTTAVALVIAILMRHGRKPATGGA